MRSKFFLLQVVGLIIISCAVLVNCDGQVKDRAQTIKLSKEEKKKLKRAIIENEKQEIINKVTSEREDPRQAAIMAMYYKMYHRLQTVAADGRSQPLDSFIFRSGDLSKILDFNTGDGIKPDKLVLKFGQLSISRGPRWHMIAYGMSDGKLIEGDLSKAPIFDDAPFDVQPNNPIDSSKAKKLRNEYMRPRRRLVTRYRCGNKNIDLEGFSFEAWQIREIISKNPSDSDPVVFKFGAEPLNEDGDEQTEDIRWHIIAYGLSDSKLVYQFPRKEYKIKPSKLIASVFDKADPCPPCK